MANELVTSKQEVIENIKYMYENWLSYQEIWDLYLCNWDYIRQIYKWYRFPWYKMCEIWNIFIKNLDKVIYDKTLKDIEKLFNKLKKIDKDNAIDDFISITYTDAK